MVIVCGCCNNKAKAFIISEVIALLSFFVVVIRFFNNSLVE